MKRSQQHNSTAHNYLPGFVQNYNM